MVRMAENQLGIIIEINDRFNNQEATVTMVGPRYKVELAESVLGLVAKGVHSALTRIRLFEQVALPGTGWVFG